MQVVTLNFEKDLFRNILMVCAFATLVAIGVYAYLGTFSRYMADDYCEAVRTTRSTPINAAMERYLAGASRASNRYSNILFVGISELFGKNNMQITIILMVILWVTGLVWCLIEIRNYFKIIWSLWADIFLGTLLGFFSLLLAPNLFQTIHWRSSMMTHFAPLVFGAFLFAFLINQSRDQQIRSYSVQMYLIAFMAAFIIAGFSEPPATTLITALFLMMLAGFFSSKCSYRSKQLSLYASAFAGVLVGLLVMIFSPAGVRIAQERDLDVVLILSRSIHYSYLFLIDSLKTVPLPIFLSSFLPFLLIFLYRYVSSNVFPPVQRRTIWIFIMGTPVLMLLLIASGFAPSVYGQSYPVERMRFLARTIMVATMMLEGGLFGLLAGDLRLPYKKELTRWSMLVMFVSLAVGYPLRAAINVYESYVPVYRAHAESWDERDAQIRSAVEKGATDLVVVQLDSMSGVGEYKGDVTHWINRCAADYYDLDALRAP